MRRVVMVFWPRLVLLSTQTSSCKACCGVRPSDGAWTRVAALLSGFSREKMVFVEDPLDRESTGAGESTLRGDIDIVYVFLFEWQYHGQRIQEAHRAARATLISTSISSKTLPGLFCGAGDNREAVPRHHAQGLSVVDLAVSRYT